MTETTQTLAERIANLLQEGESENSDFAFLRSSIEKINVRLTNIEAKLNNPNSNGFVHPSPYVLHPSKPHPSQEKFQVAEAVAPEMSQNFETEKACIFELNGKPCDHCSMCSSRGF